MSESEDQSGDKWMCRVCTYRNWPKSTKCTMCLHPKASPFIVYKDEIEDSSSQYKPSSPLISDESRRIDFDQRDADRSLSNPYKKWSCGVCTYLNWPKSGKCTQCRTPRNSISGSNCRSERFNSLNITPTKQQQHQRISPVISPNSEQRRASTPPFNKNSRSNDNDRINYGNVERSRCTRSPVLESASCSVIETVSSNNTSTIKSPFVTDPLKWTCEACTYENWPKSTKCVICFTARNVCDSSFSPLRSSPESPIQPNEMFVEKAKSPSPVEGSSNNQFARSVATKASSSSNNYIEERRLRQLHRRRKCIIKDIRDAEWTWLNACIGVIDGDRHAVEVYLNSGGSPERQLTPSDVAILGRPSAFESGYTLVHLAVRFRREDILALLLSGASDVSSNKVQSLVSVKRVPSDFCQDIAAYIRRNVASSIRQRKSDFPCFYITSELVTFALPSAIEDLPDIIQDKLFAELLDKDVQKELEEESQIINWNLELTDRLGSRLHALWNRTAGDCLLDSVLQATWGVFDLDNTVRRAMADSLSEAAAIFYPRWKESEAIHAHLMQFSLDESQWQQDWAILLSLASQPGSSLEQLHIFALCHVLRRPIIVYGVKYVKSFRGETIGLARFEGVYLPLLWEPSFCFKTPVSLGYTRGHFSALVPLEPDNIDGGNLGATGTTNNRNGTNNEDLQMIFLPLMTSDMKLLPIHFLTSSEIGREEELLRQWLDCCVTEGGILVAQQRIQKRPTLVRQMLDEWLQHYQRLSHMLNDPADENNSQQYSSDGENNSDKEGDD